MSCMFQIKLNNWTSVQENCTAHVLFVFIPFFFQKANRRPGDRWMIRGPLEYVPSVKVEVVTKRKAIPLDENEGIYVRDIKTGKVRAICGNTYMLSQDEELWAKELPPGVEELLSQGKDPVADRSDRSEWVGQWEGFG